jgi:hypothetical protein
MVRWPNSRLGVVPQEVRHIMVGRVRRPTGGRALMVLAVAIAMMGSGVSATIIVPADFSEMVAESQLVVHGRVVEVRAQMVGSFRTIESVVTIAVQEAIKGEPGDTVSMRVPGGQIGRYRRFMVGAPVFRPGEEVVIFLSGRAPAMPMPFGLSQGVYRVSRGADGRSLVAAPVLAEGRIVRGDPARRPIEVASFVQRVRAAMGSAR